MQTTYFRNKLYIYGSQALIIALLLLGSFANTSYAQKSAKSRTINMPDYDFKKLHYGFQIGLFNYGMKAKYGANGIAAVTQRATSFSLGFITNFRLKDDLWALRILPNVSFYERSFLNVVDSSVTAYEATVVEIPILLKYKSRRRKNHRMYMIGGLTAAWEVGSKEIDGLAFRKNNLELSYGAGFDLYWSFFKFSPEIRFSHGLFNMLDVPSVGGIDRLYSHKVALYLNFE